MTITECRGGIVLSDFEPAPERFKEEFIGGLKRQPKAVPCKFLYDEQGSRLFDQICELDEYYPTRTEISILRDKVGEVAALCGPRCLLVELGSGRSHKTRLLLEHLEEPVAYVPIDISRPHLLQASQALKSDYYPLEILPVCADYNQPLALPSPGKPPERRILFFPGSTIGNFEPWEAMTFLRSIAGWCAAGDGLLIGVDLEKEPEILRRAYNDAKGVTAAFNLNLLERANSELGANFVPEQFAHRAIYDEARGRIEMRLVSRARQRVRVAGEQIAFDRGEHIRTEYSYKYRPETFCKLASLAGWECWRTWTDERRWFSVHYLRLDSSLAPDRERG